MKTIDRLLDKGKKQQILMRYNYIKNMSDEELNNRILYLENLIEVPLNADTSFIKARIKQLRGELCEINR